MNFEARRDEVLTLSLLLRETPRILILVRGLYKKGLSNYFTIVNSLLGYIYRIYLLRIAYIVLIKLTAGI